MQAIHDPRKAVIRELACRYDYWADQEQELVGQGRYDEAAEAHDRAMILVRAYKAELDDVDPAIVHPFVPCPCDDCVTYMWRDGGRLDH